MRLEGGKRRSLIVVAASSCVNRTAARASISGGNRRDLPVAKKRSVSAEAKERITKSNINYLFMSVNGDSPLWRRLPWRYSGAAPDALMTLPQS